jgi:hypothetical protein
MFIYAANCKKAKWALDRSSFDFYEALDKLRLEWKCEGLLAVEPEGVMNGALFESFLKAMRTMRKWYVSVSVEEMRALISDRDGK